MKAAFISYKRFDFTRKNGWYGRRAFLLQNSGKPNGGVNPMSSPKQRQEEAIEVIRSMIEENLKDILKADKIFFYLGKGSYESVRVLLEKNINPEKITFVSCDCDEEEKKQFLRDSGFENPEIIDSECGGEFTMKNLFERRLSKRLF